MITAISSDLASVPVSRPANPPPENATGSASGGSVEAAAYSPTRLTFDEELQRLFVEVRDVKTGEVQVEFPPRELVKFYHALDQKLGIETGGSETAEEAAPVETGAVSDEAEDAEPAPTTTGQGGSAGGDSAESDVSDSPTRALNTVV
eukprot:TRINITY_DN44723_c0_g2_i2.p3 TRINITY_DN44723_c0_g2~~TRINITY_DN44723_c0_g2_i2.p3  ORF type:complete len:148 (+),score=32.35 TRINITY_DN44723_c0_g2_i2:115-558(+)